MHDAQRAPDIDVVHIFRGFDIKIECWRDDGLTSIVDEVVELAARCGLDFLDGSVDAGSRGGAKGEQSDVGEVGEVGQFG